MAADSGFAEAEGLIAAWWYAGIGQLGWDDLVVERGRGVGMLLELVVGKLEMVVG